MLTQCQGTVTSIYSERGDVQEIRIGTPSGERSAINYRSLTGTAHLHDEVLLNTTAQTLKLGTGGFDFVMANLSHLQDKVIDGPGHIIKGRYLPCQHAVLTVEEQEQYAAIWEKQLDGLPVLLGQVHSQIAPAAAGLAIAGRKRVVYIMTDGAALPLEFSRLVGELRRAGLLAATITCGQAFGGDYETVTLHSALLAARHIADADSVIVCQGPGNAGTGTRYGFSGIEQAQNIDIAARLAGRPIAIARISRTDARERHQGISHHTRTALSLAYARCTVAIPMELGIVSEDLPRHHRVAFVPGSEAALQLLTAKGIMVTSMGRTPEQDPPFFLAAAAAGLAADRYGSKNEKRIEVNPYE